MKKIEEDFNFDLIQKENFRLRFLRFFQRNDSFESKEIAFFDGLKEM